MQSTGTRPRVAVSGGGRGNLIFGTTFSASDQIISDTSWGVGYLVFGASNYEFCVTAVNGALESGMSNCVTPPRP